MSFSIFFFRSQKLPQRKTKKSILKKKKRKTKVKINKRRKVTLKTTSFFSFSLCTFWEVLLKTFLWQCHTFTKISYISPQQEITKLVLQKRNKSWLIWGAGAFRNIYDLLSRRQINLGTLINKEENGLCKTKQGSHIEGWS